MATLFEPLTVCGWVLKNRIVVAPMTRLRANADRTPNPLMALYYGQRADAGMIITEATAISAAGNGWLGAPAIYTPAQRNAWRQLVEELHSRGAPVVIQLAHQGRLSHSSFSEKKQPPVAPSALRLNDFVRTAAGRVPYETPRALESHEISAIVDDYRQAADYSFAAGFDGIEIAVAFGNLLDLFVQSKTNRRTDNYGGSLRNRCRLVEEVVEAVLGVSPSQRIGVKITPNSPVNDMGCEDNPDTFLYLAERLAAYPLAYLHVTDGLSCGFHGQGNPMRLEDFRSVFKGTLIANGGYDRQTAEAALVRGSADLVAFGTPFISNPDLALRFRHQLTLNPNADQSVWYSPGAAGYVDYPLSVPGG